MVRTKFGKIKGRTNFFCPGISNNCIFNIFQILLQSFNLRWTKSCRLHDSSYNIGLDIEQISLISIFICSKTFFIKEHPFGIYRKEISQSLEFFSVKELSRLRTTKKLHYNNLRCNNHKWFAKYFILILKTRIFYLSIRKNIIILFKDENQSNMSQDIAFYILFYKELISICKIMKRRKWWSNFIRFCVTE